MTINPTSGLIAWTPLAAQVPSASVTVRVSDGKGGSATQSYTITVAAAPTPNQQPTIISTPVTTGTEGQAYAYDVNATDPDAGDTLTYELTTAPTGMTINPTSGLIALDPAGRAGPLRQRHRPGERRQGRIGDAELHHHRRRGPDAESAADDHLDAGHRRHRRAGLRLRRQRDRPRCRRHADLRTDHRAERHDHQPDVGTDRLDPAGRAGPLGQRHRAA